MKGFCSLILCNQCSEIMNKLIVSAKDDIHNWTLWKEAGAPGENAPMTQENM